MYGDGKTTGSMERIWIVVSELVDACR